MAVKIVSLFLFPFILLLVRDEIAAAITNGGGALRRYRLRDLYGIVYPISSDRERRRNQSIYYKLNGRRYFVMKERQCGSGPIKIDNAGRESSPMNGEMNDSRRSNKLSKNKRKPLFLDASKRQAFREYHRLGLHLRWASLLVRKWLVCTKWCKALYQSDRENDNKSPTMDSVLVVCKFEWW